MNMRQEQNIGQTKFFQKTWVPQNLIIGQVFINVRVQKSKLFSKYATFHSFFYHILCIFKLKLVKNLMPGQNLLPKT